MDGRQSGKERAANLLSGMVFCFNRMLELVQIRDGLLRPIRFDLTLHTATQEAQESNYLLSSSAIVRL